MASISPLLPISSSLQEENTKAIYRSATAIQVMLWFGLGAPASYGTNTAWWGSYDTQASPLLYEHVPSVLFDRILNGLEPTTNPDPQRRKRQRSAVDLLRGEIIRIRNHLPSDDIILLDQHVDALNQLETSFIDQTLMCQVVASGVSDLVRPAHVSKARGCSKRTEPNQTWANHKTEVS